MKLTSLMRDHYYLYILLMTVLIAALAIAVMLGTFRVVILLKDALGLSEGLPLVILLISVGSLGLALVAFIAVKLTTPRFASWAENLKRYPQVKAAIARYQKQGEVVRKFLPAYVIDGRRYFFTQYFPRGQEWTAGAESGVLVLDEAGRAQTDESLFRRAATLCRYASSASFNFMHQERRNALKAGHKLASALATARRFLEARLLDKLDGEARTLVRTVLERAEAHVNKIQTLMEEEEHWAMEQGEQVEYEEQSFVRFLTLRKETSQWYERDAPATLEAWRRLKDKRSEIERKVSMTAEERRQWQRVMSAFQVVLEFAETEGYREALKPERIEAYRSRLAWVREVDKQQKSQDKMEPKEMAG